MNIPNKINIAGKEVTIRIDHHHCMTQKIYGESQYDQNTIILDDHKKAGYPKAKIEQTFIHEVLHFANAIMSRNNDNVDDENYVNPLSELLYQVFKQLKETP